ncbi:MAG: VCBS repeat-containing protein [Paraglaciecola sp.]|uniref:FG-GAP repeat domain-containing protein n=1 Tax=Paraglaciecola sp. TaxID=1920173 RepID=UPI0032987D86
MKKLYLAPVVLVAVLLVVVTTRFILDKNNPYEISTEGVSIPEFDSYFLDFDQKLKDSESLPFTASAIIDIDNDGKEELFIGGGPNQKDIVFGFKQEKLQPLGLEIISKPDLQDATFAATVLDVDGNGFSDLIVTRTTGIWLYLNESGQFTAQKLDLPLPSDTTPLSVAVADINRDGYFDMYVSGYIKKELVEGQNIFNKKGYGGDSVMLLNNGDNSFSDITDASGLRYKHNTFMGIFVDIDNDGLEDLVVAHDTGHVKTWKNLGNNKFKDHVNPNSNEYGYPMGIAVTDLEDDGFADFFFSNVGSSAPSFLAKGDLRDDQIFNPKWIMFKNKGGFEFDDVAEQVKIADFEFSWGAIFEDFNLDGLDDLVVSENYIGFPPHRLPLFRLPGRFLLQKEDGQFVDTGKESGVINTGYSITPITADFNNDGYPDVVHVNIAGKSQAFINKGGDAKFLKVKLPDTVNSVAAKITVKRSDGKILRRDYILGEGLNSDQSHTQIFALGDATATEVSVHYINGEQALKSGSWVNSTVVF